MRRSRAEISVDEEQLEELALPFLPPPLPEAVVERQVRSRMEVAFVLDGTVEDEDSGGGEDFLSEKQSVKFYTLSVFQDKTCKR